MNAINEVKKLISVGETQEAIDTLQAILEGKNESLINQVYSLESQFKDVQKKMRVGIMQESSELNRINMALLSICDDAKESHFKSERKSVDTDAASSATSIFQNPMVKYGAIAVAVLIVISIIGSLGGGGSDTAVGNNTPILQEPNNVSTWHSMPSKIILEEPQYNDIQIEVTNISTALENDNTKLVSIKLKMTCIDKGIDECWESDLKYIFINPNFQIKAIVKSETSMKFKIDQTWDLDMFVKVPIDMHNGSLDMYYLNKLKHTFQLDF